MKKYYDWDQEPEEIEEQEPFFNADAVRDDKLTEPKEKDDEDN